MGGRKKVKQETKPDEMSSLTSNSDVESSSDDSIKLKGLSQLRNLLIKNVKNTCPKNSRKNRREKSKGLSRRNTDVRDASRRKKRRPRSPRSPKRSKKWSEKCLWRPRAPPRATRDRAILAPPTPNHSTRRRRRRSSRRLIWRRCASPEIKYLN